MGGAKSGTWGTKVCPKGHRSFVAKQGNEFPGKDQASGLFFLARKKKKKKVTFCNVVSDSKYSWHSTGGLTREQHYPNDIGAEMPFFCQCSLNRSAYA